jgi:hypothetical protein
MTYEAREDRASREYAKEIVSGNGDRVRRRERALFRRSPELSLAAGQLSAFRHRHHAMVLTVTPAARRQTCLTLRREREERRGKRQAEDGQQRNGD